MRITRIFKFDYDGKNIPKTHKLFELAGLNNENIKSYELQYDKRSIELTIYFNT